MKKLILLSISIVFTLLLSVGCSNTEKHVTKMNENKKEPVSTVETKKDIREIVFNQISEKDKERISGGWINGKISNVMLKEGMGIINDKSYIGKEVYCIDFPTKGDIMPNNMVVYLTMDSNKFLGYGYIQ